MNFILLGVFTIVFAAILRIFLLAICRVLDSPNQRVGMVLMGLILWMIMAGVVLALCVYGIKLLLPYGKPVAILGVAPLVVGFAISLFIDKKRWKEFGELKKRNREK